MQQRRVSISDERCAVELRLLALLPNSTSRVRQTEAAQTAATRTEGART
jgi:hypothetical protein